MPTSDVAKEGKPVMQFGDWPVFFDLTGIPISIIETFHEKFPRLSKVCGMTMIYDSRPTFPFPLVGVSH